MDRRGVCTGAGNGLYGACRHGPSDEKQRQDKAADRILVPCKVVKLCGIGETFRVLSGSYSEKSSAEFFQM